MITQAAIQLEGVIWTLPRPARHHNVLWAIYDVRSCQTPDNRPLIIPARGIQGFITEHHEFLDRKQAARHARNHGQIGDKKKTDPQDQLFSEDLW